MKHVTGCCTKACPAVGPEQMESQTASRAELAIFDKLLDGEIGLDVGGIGGYWREASAGQRRF